MIEGHGDDIHGQDHPVRHNFSSNVYHAGLDPALLDYLKKELDLIKNYPSPDAGELGRLAGTRLGVAPQQLLFTNGATEAFYLIAHYFKAQKALVAIPSFAEYEDAVKVHGLSPTYIRLGELTTHHFTEQVAFFGNPNNPDGSVRSKKEIEALLARFPQTTFVIDEAYIEFTESAETAIPLLSTYTNLIIVRSLTKAFVIPGLRLGYILSSSKQIAGLNRLKMPWSVNAPAISAGKYIMKNYQTLLFDAGRLRVLTEDFRKKLQLIPGLEVLPTQTNYFLVHLQKGTAKELKKHLIEQQGILIRDATNFRGLKGEHIRLAVQDSEANEVLLSALRIWKA